jgi:hypothetical protein
VRRAIPKHAISDTTSENYLAPMGYTALPVGRHRLGEDASYPSLPNADLKSTSRIIKNPRLHNRNLDPDLIKAWLEIKLDAFRVALWFGWGLVLGTIGCTAIAMWAVLIRAIVR